jgi:hypothetical protein
MSTASTTERRQALICWVHRYNPAYMYMQRLRYRKCEADHRPWLSDALMHDENPAQKHLSVCSNFLTGQATTNDICPDRVELSARRRHCYPYRGVL